MRHYLALWLSYGMELHAELHGGNRWLWPVYRMAEYAYNMGVAGNLPVAKAEAAKQRLQKN